MRAIYLDRFLFNYCALPFFNSKDIALQKRLYSTHSLMCSLMGMGECQENADLQRYGNSNIKKPNFSA